MSVRCADNRPQDGRNSLTRSLTVGDAYTVARAKPMPSIDLDVYFDFNSAGIRSQAEPQFRELGAALTDPRLKGATISIGGHTDAVGGYAFNQKLSERRAMVIKQYMVDNFQLPPENIRAVGFGKQRPLCNSKELADLGNRRCRQRRNCLQCAGRANSLGDIPGRFRSG